MGFLSVIVQNATLTSPAQPKRTVDAAQRTIVRGVAISPNAVGRAVIAASTITNYTGSIARPPLEAQFQEHAWQA